MATALLSCFAIAAPGLEPLVARELAALGEQPRPEDGGVSWEGDARSIMRANLWLRTATRVVVRVARFRATAFYELERRARRIEWPSFLAPGRAAEFRVTTHKSRLYHSDAIAERLAKAAGGRAGGKADRDAQLFVVRVVDDVFEISADSSGDLLHQRGYRQAVGKAPLRETLAAALLLGAGWTGDMPLLDPFCGSGTIPIEGALIARRIAPGKRRHFGFMQWPDHAPDIWRAELDAAVVGELAASPVPLLGSDRDAGATQAARANAERAGVAADVAFETRAVSTIEPPAGSGLVAANPPYGVRVGGGKDLRNLYAAFGQTLRRVCPGWTMALYAAEPGLAAATGFEFRELFRTSNGGLPITACAADVAARTSGLD